MVSNKMKVVKCPTDDLATTNCAVVSAEDYDARGVKHVVVTTEHSPHPYIFSIKNHSLVRPGEIAFANTQRQWASLSLAEPINVQPFTFQNNQYIGAVTVSCNFQKKKDVTPEPLDTDLMSREFSMQFGQIALTVGEKLVFQFTDAKGKIVTLSLGIKSIEGIDLNAVAAEKKSQSMPINSGQLLPNSTVIFDKEEGAQVNLIGKAKGKTAYRSIINPDFDFQKMGIGGLDTEFTSIFRRAFASRVFPPEFIEQLGMKHVRGILLFGPPGTGKTLMARQIGKMLNAREPKIVNGPQILDKYVGESESNVRKLFADAEEEWKRCGSNSALHMIIFDEIDAICKQRGSMAGSSSVHDTVVNQLLSKMDGVEQLNNILVIGMTNRKDMIDEALLRPGRLEVQVEISLPDEAGRLQILNIHTSRMREYNKLDPNVDLPGLAAATKNFSGAELEGLVRAAQSSAMNRLVKAGGKVQADPDAIEKLMINADDFSYALENDIKPAFGKSDDTLQKFINRGLIKWGPPVDEILTEGRLLVDGITGQPDYGFATAVLIGSRGSGTSCLAAHIAKYSDFPFVKVIDPADLIGFSETAKCQVIKKAFSDACRSKDSVLLIDSVERIVDYTPVGPRFSNLVLQTLLVMLNQPPPHGHRLLILATSSSASFLRELELDKAFGVRIQVPSLSTADEMLEVVGESESFSKHDIDDLKNGLTRLMMQQSLCIKREEGRRGTILYQQLEGHALQL